jgi:hypothetical protein
MAEGVLYCWEHNFFHTALLPHNGVDPLFIHVKSWQSFLNKHMEPWDITPCSPLKVNRRFGGTYRLHLQGRCHLISRWFLARLILRPCRWRRCSSVTSVHFQRATWRYIPEDSTFHNHRSENLKSYTWNQVLLQNLLIFQQLEKFPTFYGF